MKRFSITLVMLLCMLCFSDTAFGYLAYSQDFEASDGGYTHSGTEDVWQWGTPTAWPNSAASGSKCWGTNLAGSYPNNADFSLVSDWIDLTAYPAGTPLTLKWKQALDIESSNFDNASCSGETDLPETETLWEHPGSSISQQSWTELSADISFAAGKEFRLTWSFSTDSSVTNAGLFLDDVVIEIDISPATDPYPEDHATERAHEDLILSWVCESADSFDLYFGSISIDLGLISEDMAVTSFDLPLLDQGNTYYWRVDVASGDIVVSGDLWSFTTLLDKPAVPDPSNGAEDAPNTDVVVSWEHFSNNSSFDVYFGLSSDDLEPIATKISERSVSLADDLDFLTEYFWRVDVETEDAAESGDLWSFTTAEEEKTTEEEKSMSPGGGGSCSLGTFPIGLMLLVLPLALLLKR